MRKIFLVLLALLISTPLIQLPAFGTTDTRALEVLEVQPGTSYDLTTNTFSTLTGKFAGRTVNLTQMSMPEFISKVDEINGKYDIVYIGNKTYGGAYSTIGQAPINLPQGGTNGTNSIEYYSGNDITNRRANTLKDFINSKQLTIFDASIFGSSMTNTKLYNNFNSFVNNSAYPNFVTVDTSWYKSWHLVTALSVYNNVSVAQRPILTLNNRPTMYDGTDASYQTDKTLGYNFDINNQTKANNMIVKLFIDINGDGIFKAVDDNAGKSEVVYESDNQSSNTGYTINYHLPDTYIGLEPWKLELTDTSTGAKSYVTGATAFRATKSGDEVNIRLLQLEPAGNSLSIYSLSNVNGQNLLYKDKVYRIQVTEMNIADFNAAYAHASPPPVAAKINGVAGTASTVLNGNYDMVIMGFADLYGGNDLTNPSALQALEDFITTNQSVMFTHDTLTFDVDSPNTWGYNITQNFRNIVGQQRYYRTAPDSTRSYDLMPNASKDTYGFTNLTLGRYNNGLYNDGNTFETTTKTHKINDNLVTQFPFPLGDIAVAPTHFQYFQLDLEDPNVVPVYTLTNDWGSTMYNHPGDGRNDYYTYTKGTITFSGTGHSKVSGLPEEQMFVNTIIKASRGANHAPTLKVTGISEGMNISNTLKNINFSITATDCDLNDKYLNADIYLSKSIDGTNFSAYQNVSQFRATDPNTRIISGVDKAVSVLVNDPNTDSGVIAYKVKVVSYDSWNAQISQEFNLNNMPDPSISAQSANQSCLVGDTINIPVSINATATALNETFQSINLQGILTNPDNSTVNIYNTNLPDLIFNPNSSWPNNTQSNSYPLTFNTAGNYTILNKLTYSAYNGVPPSQTGPTSRENDQSFNISVNSGQIDVVVQDMKDRGIPGITVNVNGSQTGTTSASGSSSFMGLSSGSYTVTISAPNGLTVLGGTSQTINMSASNPYQTVLFKLSGNLITNPSITTPSGATQMSILADVPLQTVVGFELKRPAKFLKIALNNSISGKDMDVEIHSIKCDGDNVDFTIVPGDPEDSDQPAKIIKLIPSDSNHFSGGTYTLSVIVSINGGNMVEGQNFTISLTDQTSAEEDSDQNYIDHIDTVSLSALTITVGRAPNLH